MLKSVYFVAAMLMSSAAVFAAEPNDSSAVPDNPPLPYLINGGPGIVISGSADISQLPQGDRDFLAKYYPDEGVRKCKLNFVKNTAQVTLDNGTEINFDKDGKVKDIRTTDGTSLPEDVINAVLPKKAGDHLRKVNASGYVTAIKNAGDNGFCVMLLNDTPPQMIFDIDGLFIVTAG